MHVHTYMAHFINLYRLLVNHQPRVTVTFVLIGIYTRLPHFVQRIISLYHIHTCSPSKSNIMNDIILFFLWQHVWPRILEQLYYHFATTSLLRLTLRYSRYQLPRISGYFRLWGIYQFPDDDLFFLRKVASRIFLFFHNSFFPYIISNNAITWIIENRVVDSVFQQILWRKRLFIWWCKTDIHFFYPPHILANYLTAVNKWTKNNVVKLKP